MSKQIAYLNELTFIFPPELMSKIALPCLEQTQRLVVEQFLAQKVASDLLVILLSMGMEDEKKEERI